MTSNSEKFSLAKRSFHLVAVLTCKSQSKYPEKNLPHKHMFTFVWNNKAMVQWLFIQLCKMFFCITELSSDWNSFDPHLMQFFYYVLALANSSLMEHVIIRLEGTLVLIGGKYIIEYHPNIKHCPLSKLSWNLHLGWGHQVWWFVSCSRNFWFMKFFFHL